MSLYTDVHMCVHVAICMCAHVHGCSISPDSQAELVTILAVEKRFPDFRNFFLLPFRDFSTPRISEFHVGTSMCNSDIVSKLVWFSCENDKIFCA